MCRSIRSLLIMLAFFWGIPVSITVGQFQAGTLISLDLDTPTEYPAAAIPATQEEQWHHVLHHDDATYIAIHFSSFDLAAGDFLRITDANGGQVRELRGRGKLDAGSFWARHIKGDTAILSFVVSSATGGPGFTMDEYAAGFVNLDPVAEPQSVCGTDDRLNAICFAESYPDEYEASRSGVRLLINGVAYCSGSLVSEYNLVLTNNHCISSQSKALNTDFDFMAEAPTCETENCSECFGGTVFSGGRLIASSGLYDYALLEVMDGDAAAQFPVLGFDVRPPVVGERIYIPQHPDGEAREIALLSSHPDDTGGVVRVQSVTEDACLAPIGLRFDMGYYGDTMPGASGSPVIAAMTHKLIGLHHCGGCPNLGIPVIQFYDEIEPYVLGLISSRQVAPGSLSVAADSALIGREADHAIDQDLDIGWTSTSSTGPHWLQLDLGLEARVRGFVVYHASASGGRTDQNTATFEIQSAPTASGPWATEFTMDNTSQESVSRVEYASPHPLRHVRLWITDPGSDTTARIREFLVIAVPWMSDELPEGVNLALNAVSVATSSNFSSAYGGDKAIDGIVSEQSKWTSADIDPPHTLTLDLGGVKSVAGFILRQPGAAGENPDFNATDVAFQSARSFSGPWFTEARVTQNDGANIISRQFTAPKDMRYVRLNIIDPGIDHYARVPEFEVIEFSGILASFTATPTRGSAPLPVQFTDMSVGEVTSRLWTFGDGASSDEQSPQHTYTTTGTHTVSLQVNGPAGSDSVTHVDYIAVMPVKADWDDDGDVDMSDYAVLQACLTGGGVAIADPACERADLDHDEDVDGADLNRFLGCFNGDRVAPPPSCEIAP